MQLLAETFWKERRERHRLRVEALMGGQLRRERNAPKHPIYDFLFEYYRFRPGQLRQWHPGVGVAIPGDQAEEFLALPGYHRNSEGVTANPESLNPSRRESLNWLRSLLALTLERPPVFGCHGLHEWAMVYRETEVRYPFWPLRFPAEQIAEIVESQSICCTHFDAFRHFSETAKPLNRLSLTRPTTRDHEQRGCLHANMDLYKWAFKFTPFIPSELTLDAFELAVKIREIDMRASPYDFRELGFEPIPIETADGRKEYEKWQRQFAEAGQPIRRRLLTELERIE